MNRGNSRRVIRPQSRKSKALIVSIITILISMLVIFAVFIFSDGGRQLSEDRLQNNEIIIEGIGTFSFNPDAIIAIRSDLYKEDEFSIFDVVAFLDNEKYINVENYFDESSGSYTLDSINGIQYWAYVAVNQSEEIVKTGVLSDRSKYDNKSRYIIINIDKEDFQYAYGERNQDEYQELENIDLLTNSQKAIKQIIEGNVDISLVDELKDAGYSEETIALLKNQINVNVPNYTDGNYKGIADAHNGSIVVEVMIFEGKIIFIDVVSHEETAPNLADVFRIIPINILKNQSTELVDTISGATEASQGYIQAVNDALSKAIN